MKSFVILALAVGSTLAQAETMCGTYIYQEESFTGPEKSWLAVPGRGRVELEFAGRTPMMDEGAEYCCPGEYEDRKLRVTLGCDPQ